MFKRKLKIRREGDYITATGPITTSDAEQIRRYIAGSMNLDPDLLDVTPAPLMSGVRFAVLAALYITWFVCKVIFAVVIWLITLAVIQAVVEKVLP